MEFASFFAFLRTRPRSRQQNPTLSERAQYEFELQQAVLFLAQADPEYDSSWYHRR